jgi:type IV secretion system protein VirB10
MSGIIEPSGTKPAEGAPSPQEGDRQVDPSIIPSVAEHARAGVSTSTKVVFAAAGLAIVAALVFVLWHLILRPLHVELPKASAPPAVASASGAAKRFDTLPPAETARTAAEEDKLPAVPAIEPDMHDPIGLRRTGAGSTRAPGTAPGSGLPAKLSEDAPVLLARLGASGVAGAAAVGAASGADAGASDPLAETRASLREYRHQLGRSLESLQAMIPGASNQTGASRPTSAVAGVTAADGVAVSARDSAGGGAGGRGVLGMQASDLPPARAGVLGNRSLVLPQGTSLTCALTTRVVSAQAGFIGCQVLRNVYGADGRVLLIERGSHLIGEYRVTQVRPGSTRIPALWTRLRTPGGVNVDLDSPATGPLGESGADAYVDNRWFERVGAAMLVSVLDDSIKIVLNNETAPQQGNNSLVFQGTSQTASQMAEKVLDATINLPPLLYANQGSLVGVFVARDIDFSSVYELQPAAE